MWRSPSMRTWLVGAPGGGGQALQHACRLSRAGSRRQAEGQHGWKRPLCSRCCPPADYFTALLIWLEEGGRPNIDWLVKTYRIRNLAAITAERVYNKWGLPKTVGGARKANGKKPKGKGKGKGKGKDGKGGKGAVNAVWEE